jgi:hypothetical protein
MPPVERQSHPVAIARQPQLALLASPSSVLVVYWIVRPVLSLEKELHTPSTQTSWFSLLFGPAMNKNIPVNGPDFCLLI